MAGLGVTATTLAVVGARGSFPFWAQPRVARIGLLGTGLPSTTYLIDAFRDGLREAGWVDGQNLIIEDRWYGDHSDRIPDLADELVALKPDVLTTSTPPAVLAFMRASESIPIVMLVVSDPVDGGLIASYARPGGNVTGIARNAAISLGVKLFDLVQQLVPGLMQVAFVFESANPASLNGLRDVQALAHSVGVEVQPIEISSPEDLEPALDAALASSPQALISIGGTIITPYYSTIAGFAIQHHLPTASDQVGSLPAAGLMYYGPSQVPLFRRGGSYYADRILRGAKPADLPVEQPTVFDLIVNRTTVQALGLTLPSDFSAQVTEWVD
jgi:putative ABC transport system substrate-binding protein